MDRRLMLRKAEAKWFILGADVVPTVKRAPRPSCGTIIIEWAMMATAWSRGHIDFEVDERGNLSVVKADWARPSDLIIQELERWGRPTKDAIEALAKEDPRQWGGKWWEETIYTRRVIDCRGVGFSYDPGRDGGTNLILPTYPVRMFQEYPAPEAEKITKSAADHNIYVWWVSDDDGC